ncbi:anti-sigma factor family protein [Nonomuraea typhae]|uniref:anti-sigma factor family protein n=1 Tax=Nonomuraea typhae TaxID=2603600 RepID=UPI001FE98722|nr:zf-HC2 domain-containing protein [Nonomuraea typhae]
MTCEEVRLSLGAHALGALDPEEALEVDTHLATCEVCGAELLELEGVSAFLGKVSERDVELVVSPPRRVLERLLNDRAKRSRRGRVFLVVAASAAVLAVGGTFWTNTTGGGGNSTAAAPAGKAESAQHEDPAAAAAPDTRDQSTSAYSDATTPMPERSMKPKASPTESAATLSLAAGKKFAGTLKQVKAEVMAMPGENGTDLNVEVSGVPIGTTCRLLVVDSDGKREPVGSWEVSRENYETPPVFRAETKLKPAEIRSIQVVDQDGRLLVKAVPA